MSKSGSERAAIVFLEDAYGRTLTDEFTANFESGQRRVVASIAYADTQQNFRPIVDQLAESSPEAILIIGYSAPSASIFIELERAGLTPSAGLEIWAVDGNVGLAGEMPQSSRASLEGLQQTVPGPNLRVRTGREFLDRIEVDYSSTTAASSFVAETYDALVILALAAASSESATSQEIAASINSATKDGEPCSSFAECAELLSARRRDIDYNGLEGVYEFTDEGEPYVAIYRVDTYGSDGPIESTSRYVSGTVCDVCFINRFQPPIEFEAGSSNLEPDCYTALREVAAILLQPEVGQVEVQGFADTTGSPDTNLALSQDRAESVLRFLTAEAGVPDNKLVARGYGGTSEFPQNRIVLFAEIE